MHLREVFVIEKPYPNYKQGFITEEDLEEFVELWHMGDSKESLHEYLGMTWDEYKTWIEKGIL